MSPSKWKGMGGSVREMTWEGLDPLLLALMNEEGDHGPRNVSALRRWPWGVLAMMRRRFNPWPCSAVSCGIGHRRGLDLAWLWHRPVAIALIQLLAWEPPYAADAALKKNEGGLLLSIDSQQVYEDLYSTYRSNWLLPTTWMSKKTDPPLSLPERNSLPETLTLAQWEPCPNPDLQKYEVMSFCCLSC